jgi:hypothetical protein
VLERVGAQESDPAVAGQASLDGCLLALIRHASSFPAGTFVFVVSDFIDAVSPNIWLKLRALRWDITPVVIQDPTWEQSFPAVGGVLLPVRDPATGDVGEVMVSGREARDRARVNEHRLESMLGVFARLGFDPVVLGSSEPSAIAEGFDRWASRRRRLRRRSA